MDIIRVTIEFSKGARRRAKGMIVVVVTVVLVVSIDYIFSNVVTNLSAR